MMRSICKEARHFDPESDAVILPLTLTKDVSARHHVRYFREH